MTYRPMQERFDAAPGADDAMAPSGGAPRRPVVRRITSSDLLAGSKEVIIEHESADYRLRRTSKGKLILTK